MIEYRIETQAELKKVYQIWKKFLQNDQTWHFTLEDTYIELRIKRKIVQLDLYLKKRKWKFITFEYKDTIDITRKYQTEFEDIFHGYSVLSMKLFPMKDEVKKDKEMGQLFDRCMHLFFNAFSKDMIKDSRIVMEYIIGRAYTAGYYTAQSQLLKQQKEEHGRKK